MKKQHVGAGLGVLAILAAVLFVVYRWRHSGFVWGKFVAVFSDVSWSWLSLAMALILATYAGRALRWEIMLRPLTSQVQMWRLFVATCIGFTAVVLFGRAGEPVRPYLIARKEGVSFSSQIAAWLVERILDLLMVLLIFGIALTQISRSGIQPGPHIQSALQAAGLSFVLGTRIPFLPDVVREWRDKHPDEAIPDGLVLTQPWPATSSEKARGIPDRVVYYQYRHDRARRTLRGIDEQVAKAQRAVDGQAPVKRNRFIKLTGASKSVNRELEAKARGLAGWKGYADVGVMPTGGGS